MKKIISMIIAFSFAFNIITPPAVLMANESNENISEGMPSIEYDDKLNGYILNNITVEEVLALFESDDDFVRQGTTKISGNVDRKVLDSLDIDQKNVSMYSTDYVLSRTVQGVYKEEFVNIYYTCNMNMTTVRYNGVNYAQFVSFNLKPTYWLGSGPYAFGEGTGEVGYYIKNGGATIQVQQIVQLKTTSAVSTSGQISAGWVSMGSSTSTTSYYRGPATTYFTTKNLPLYNIIN